MNPNIPQSQAQLVQVYDNAITTLNPNLAPAIQGSDLYFKANATSQIGANIIQDIQLVANNIFAASSSGVYLDKHAGALGMTPRMGGLPSQCSAPLQVGTGGSTFLANYTILAGTTMQDAITNNQYITTVDVEVAIGDTIVDTLLPIISVNLGTGTESPPNDVLTFTTPIVISSMQTITSCAVPATGMVLGSNVENDNTFAARIFNYSLNPRGGGSIGDYYAWCFLGSPNVTQVQIFTTNSIGTNNIVFPIILEGNPDPNYYIDGNISNGFAEAVAPIQRNASLIDIASVQSYIDNVNPVNANPDVLTAATYEFNATIPEAGTYFNVYVSLSAGLTLSTQLTLPNLPSPGYITVEAIIQREFRRAIISSPLGGSAIPYNGVTDQRIPISFIEDTIMQGLANNSNLQGNFASLLLGIQIAYFPGGISNPTTGYISVPSLQDSNEFVFIPTLGTYEALIVYDIDVSILNVILAGT